MKIYASTSISRAFLIIIDLLNMCWVISVRFGNSNGRVKSFLILKYFHPHLYVLVSRTNLNYTIYHAWLSFVDPLQWRGDLCCCFFTLGISAHSWFTKYAHNELFYFLSKFNNPPIWMFFFRQVSRLIILITIKKRIL